MKLIYKNAVYRQATEMPLQVMLLGNIKGEFDIDKFYKKNCTTIVNDKYHNKPHCEGQGLIWTSSLEGESTDWLRFCKQAPEFIGDKAALFKVKTSARILHLLTKQDYELALQHYAGEPYKGTPTAGYTSLNYSALVKDGYQAVHVGEDPRHINAALQAWEAESTAWFDTLPLHFIKLVNVDKQCAIPTEKDKERWQDPYDGGYAEEMWHKDNTEYSLKLSQAQD
jgi:hypothetical protein